MVNAVYDHIIAIVIIGIVFIGAVVVLPAVNFVNERTVDQQQLRNIALNVFNSILLDTGKGFNGTHWSTDWGSFDPFNESFTKIFGLSSSYQPGSYVLDPYKVQRLVKGYELGTISYKKVKEILGIEDYSFNLKILPPFNITNTNGTRIDNQHSPITLSGSNLRYAIKVTYLDGKPIPNAIVITNIFYTTKDDFQIVICPKKLTNPLGLCEDSIALSTKDEIKSLIAVFKVTVADVATMVVTYKSSSVNIADINLIGDKLILTRTKDTPNDNVWILNGTYISGDRELNYLFNASKKNDQLYKLNTGAQRMWSKEYRGLSYDDPIFFVFNFWAVDPAGNGRSEIVIAGPSQNIMGYTVFEFGAALGSSRASVRLQRSVIISGLTYIAELTLWKDSL